MKKQLPTRKNIRLKDYDYSEEGTYFITICTKNRECILSKIETCRGVHCTSDSTIVLTKIGEIVDKYIKKIEEIYTNTKIDEYIIMPNHIHIILIIDKAHKTTISKIIQQLKGVITKELKYPIWQKLFYEHIIRNEKEYIQIKKYIINNPINWETDIHNGRAMHAPTIRL